MANEAHYRKLEQMYLSAPTNEYYRPGIQIKKGEAEIRMAVRPEFFHAAHAVHGSVYFKMLDDAAFFAVNSLVEDVFVLTAEFNLYLLRPIQQGEMVSRGRVIHRSRRLFIAESELLDSRERILARGSGTFLRSEIPLNADVGYI